MIASRHHDISTGHRVHGHEGKCRHLHGHNYRILFLCEETQLDEVGRVVDFSVIKSELCMWIEDHWDHRFLVWQDDPLASSLVELDPAVVVVPFNPTAENMAAHLVDVIGPQQLQGRGVVLRRVQIEETAKCSVTYELPCATR